MGASRVKEEELEQGGPVEGGLAYEERKKDNPRRGELGKSPTKRRMSSSSDYSEYRTLKRVKQELLDDADKSRSTSDRDTIQYANKTI